MTPKALNMQGRRVPDDISPSDYEPGDYGRRGSMWWVCLPTGVLGHIDERWTVEEHEDGTATIGEVQPTITVNPSIWDSPQGWHGWLDHGFWRSV